MEYISVAVRYVKEGEASESVLQMPATVKLDARSLSQLRIETLKDALINTTAMISQCYDGGTSCTSGDRGRVQKLIQQALNEEIPYVHCYKQHLVMIYVLFYLFYDQIGML